jgi:hypothetical protein
VWRLGSQLCGNKFFAFDAADSITSLYTSAFDGDLYTTCTNLFSEGLSCLDLTLRPSICSLTVQGLLTWCFDERLLASHQYWTRLSWRHC